MPTPQRLPIVNGDDGQWGTILKQYLQKEHYDDGTDNAVNGGHQKVTIRAGTATAGTAPLKFTSGTLLTTPEAGAMEFLTDSLYFTVTTGTVRRTIATYDDSSGATGDIYYRNSSGVFTRLGIGSTNNVLTVSGGLPSWQASSGGTVTSVSVTSANGFAGTVATSTTTPAITMSTSISGILKGNGTAISAASAGTDYQAGNSNLTTIAGLSPASNDILQYKSGAWTNRTLAQYRTDLNYEGRVTFSNANYTAQSTDRAIMQVGTMSANRTVTLPLANSVAAGYRIIIGDQSGTVASGAAIILAPSGSDILEPAAFNQSFVLSPYGWTMAVSDGVSNWYCLPAGTQISGSITAGNLPVFTSGFQLTDSGITTSTDGTFASNSDTLLPTQKASKTYTDTAFNSGTYTMTNKRITKRTGNTTSSATPTINTDNIDSYDLTAQAAAITSFTTNLSGTPVRGDTLRISITDNGTARAITWGTSFESSGTQTLPSTTVISTRLDVAFVWNTATSKWRCVAAS